MTKRNVRYVLAKEGDRVAAYTVRINRLTGLQERVPLRAETPGERRARHLQTQHRLGHFVPDGTSPRPQRTYRPYRREAIKGVRRQMKRAQAAA